MSTRNHTYTRINSVFKYLPAKLCEYKAGWMIDYSVEDPLSGTMCRKQIKLKRIVSRFRTKREARAHALEMVYQINQSLRQGEHPLMKRDDARLLTPVSQVLSAFIDEKTKELRPNTLRSYSSFVNQFSRWMQLEKHDPPCLKLSPITAVEFMDHIYSRKDVGIRSYNNYRKLGKVVASWMVEKCYHSVNFFERIKPKKNPPKRRILVDGVSRELVTDYFREHCPGMNVVIRLVYYSLVRPNEILQIKVGDVRLEDHYIVIQATVAKNKQQRFASLTPELVSMLELMRLDRFPKGYYLFGEGFIPGKEMIGAARFRKEWQKAREELKLPQEMQLYSFRDTGITDMLKSGIDDLTVMQHADHHDLSITSIYARHADPRITEIIYTKSPKF